MTMDNLKEKLKLLGISKSKIHKHTITILSELSGYSKREDLLINELTKRLYKENIGPGSIYSQLTTLKDLLELTRFRGQIIHCEGEVHDVETPPVSPGIP